MYICIDLKSFYASVECIALGLDPFTTNLVVADPERGKGTICLAITPAMKALGIKNRCRVFEIPENVDYLMVKPRMRHYMEVSAQIYGIYLRYISPDDIHVYSIDECFIDVAPYERLYRTGACGIAIMLKNAVFEQTGISATVGIGTNLFLAKVALDITAKHADDGIGFLDEEAFKREVWHHRPITDIWNIGPGIARRLEKYGAFDLWGVCMIPEELLYREFGVNARHIIEHAHGIEPCTIRDIHDYQPQGHSLSSGQVLPRDYAFADALVVFKEMADGLILELVGQELAAAGISVQVGYKRIKDGAGMPHTGGTRKLGGATDSHSQLMESFVQLFCQTTFRDKPIRRLALGLTDVTERCYAELDLFTDVEAVEEERALQEAVIGIKGRFGGNAVLKGISLLDAATARERNEQIGGHHA